MLELSEVKKKLNESKLLGASRRGQFKIVKDVVESEKIDINVQSFFTGRTPIILSAINSHEGIVEYLMERGADIEKTDFFDENLLVYAIRSNMSEKLCNSIINKSSFFNYKDDSEKTLLHLSIIHNKKSTFWTLIEKNVNVDTYDVNGISPLMCACELGNYHIVKELLDRGAKINRMDNSPIPRTVTDYASKHIDILNLLSKYKNN